MRKAGIQDVIKVVSLDEFPIPSSADAERQVIADIVNVPEGFRDFRELLEDNMFSDPECRSAFKGLCNKYDHGEALSIVTLNSIVGNPFFYQVIDKPVASLSEALGHCKALSGISRRRSMYTSSLELLKGASRNCLTEEEETIAFDGLSNALNRDREGSDWRSTVFDYTSNVTQPEPLLLCSGVPIATIENLTVISGKPKVCKTTFQSAMIAACLAGKSIMNIQPTSPFFKVLLCDTEQSPYYLSKQCDRIFRMAGIDKVSEGERAFMVLNLRPYTPQERFAYIKKAVGDYNPDLLFIDGCADFVEDTNDLQSSERMVADLLTLSSKHNLGIVTIVHSNPGGEGKVRGHLGSCLERKAETVISLERDGMDDTIKVKPRQTRNKPFDAFIMTLNNQGDPDLLSDDGPKTAEDWLIYLMQPRKEYRNAELVSMMNKKGFKKSNTQYALAESLRKGRIDKKNDGYSIVLRQDDLPDI